MNDLKVGDRIRATRDIYEGPDDCHPGGFYARRGDLLIVRSVDEHGPAVSHEHRTDCSFRIDPIEFRIEGPHQDQ